MNEKDGNNEKVNQEMIKDLYEKYKSLKNDFEIFKQSNTNELLSFSKTLTSITQKMKSSKENNLILPQPTYKHILEPMKHEDTEKFPRTTCLRKILDEQKQKIYEEHLQKMQKEKDERRIEKQRQTLLKNHNH